MVRKVSHGEQQCQATRWQIRRSNQKDQMPSADLHQGLQGHVASSGKRTLHLFHSPRELLKNSGGCVRNAMRMTCSMMCVY